MLNFGQNNSPRTEIIINKSSGKMMKMTVFILEYKAKSVECEGEDLMVHSRFYSCEKKYIVIQIHCLGRATIWTFPFSILNLGQVIWRSGQGFLFRLSNAGLLPKQYTVGLVIGEGVWFELFYFYTFSFYKLANHVCAMCCDTVESFSCANIQDTLA